MRVLSLALAMVGGLSLAAPQSLPFAGVHHTRHLELFGANAPCYNREVLQGVDIVQAHAPDGGGYFIGIKAKPPESPVNYALSLKLRAILVPPRSSSYCSGSSYAALIEALNLALPNPPSDAQLEALRMQEPDGSRREDGVKMWGWWNADGFGSHFALAQYSQMGWRIKPDDARPGDFMNISWKSGLGHSVVFLGWGEKNGDKGVLFWSSQTGTNGYGDMFAPLSKIKDVLIVRLVNPYAIYSLDPNRKVTTKIAGDVLMP